MVTAVWRRRIIIVGVGDALFRFLWVDFGAASAQLVSDCNPAVKAARKARDYIDSLRTEITFLRVS